MSGIYYLVPTLIAIAVSLLIVRAGAIALMMTAMFISLQYSARACCAVSAYPNKSRFSVLLKITSHKRNCSMYVIVILQQHYS